MFIENTHVFDNFEKKCLRLADYPDYIREQYLNFSLSSKNASSVAPSLENTPATSELDAKSYPLIPNNFWCDPDVPKDRLRNFLFSQLKQLGIKSEPANEFWPWVKCFNEELVSNIESKSKWGDEVKKEQFKRCYFPKQQGTINHYEDGTSVVQKYSCNLTGFCLWCRTKARKKLARQYYDLAIECLEKYGMSKVWSLVFTLPEELEDQFRDKKDKQKIRAEISKLVKGAFGLKTRDNLGIIFSEHPVGDKDVLRVRFHWHILVFPLYIRDNKVYYIDINKLNNEYLKEEWNKILDKFSPGKQTEAIYPELKYYKMETEKEKGKLLHRINYDLRSFAQDIEDKVLYHLDGGQRIIIKRENSEDIFWQVLPINHYAKHWLFITSQNHIFSYGFIHTLGKWQKKGFFDKKEKQEKEEPVKTEPCNIKLIRRKIFDKKNKIFRWQRYEIAEVEDKEGQKKEFVIGEDIPWA